MPNNQFYAVVDVSTPTNNVSGDLAKESVSPSIPPLSNEVYTAAGTSNSPANASNTAKPVETSAGNNNSSPNWEQERRQKYNEWYGSYGDNPNYQETSTKNTVADNKPNYLIIGLILIIVYKLMNK